MSHGFAACPLWIVELPPWFLGRIGSRWIGKRMLVMLNLPLVGLWVSMLRLPYRWLFPGILVFSCIGLFSVNASTFDVYLAALFGFAGYVFLKVGLDPAPMILGLILGTMLEETFSRSLRLSGGDPMIIINTPLRDTFLPLAVVTRHVLSFPYIPLRQS